MKQIRHSVFEANSSSSHSITLLKNGDFDDEWKESIEKLKKDRNYFGYATEMVNDHRQEEWYSQRKETGFDDTETWSLNTTIAKFALPRLKWFKERHFDNPCDITFERWNEILDNMIFSFEYYAKDEWKPISDEDFKKVEEGMKLFGEYYGDLWW